MKNIILVILVILSCFQVNAQKIFTKTGHIEFVSDAAMETIEAINNKAVSVVDLENGNIEAAVLVKGFLFEKALMQEHFNENYMESDLFPKAKFKGMLADFSKLNDKFEKLELRASGTLSIHGVSKEIELPVTFSSDGETIHAEATIELAVADYGIKIPSLVADKIAKTVELKMVFDYKPFNR